MKFKGKVVKGKNQEIIPIPRPGEDIIFIAEAVQDWSQFSELMPEPTPPTVIKPGGVRFEDVQNPNYLKAMEEYVAARTDYLVLVSLQASPDVIWETVDISKPNTWKNYRKELADADITEIEVGKIVMGVMRANSLDESMIDEARANFLHGTQESEKQP